MAHRVFQVGQCEKNFAEPRVVVVIVEDLAAVLQQPAGVGDRIQTDHGYSSRVANR
jgi:hypothetical protein